MTHFILNGKELARPINETSTLGQFINELGHEYTSLNSMISSIHVDGVELSSELEKNLADNKLETVKSIEVKTVHPKEFIEETLQMLTTFTDRLKSIAENISIELENQVPEVSFEKLVEGLEVFTDTLACAKTLLGVGYNSQIQLLEADLKSILRDLSNARETGHVSFQIELLREHLNTNIQDWKEVGIPILIRSHDS